MFFSESGYKRKFIFLKGDFVVKIEDVREKLKLCVSGGFIVVINFLKVRYISFGRKIVNNYFEKEFVNMFLVRVCDVEKKKKKKRKVRSKVLRGFI